MERSGTEEGETMARNNKSIEGGKVVDIKKRIYWKTQDGLEHGFVKRENGQDMEVYSYATGMIVLVKSKDIEKVITEVLS